MNKKLRKIIAKEFLILVSSLFLILILFICVYPYNDFQKSKINQTDKIILSKQRSLDSLDSIKTLHRLYKYKLKKIRIKGHSLNNKQIDTFFATFYNVYKKDSVIYNWYNDWDIELKNVWGSIGIKSGEQLKDFYVKYDMLDKTKDINQINQDIIKLDAKKFELEQKGFFSELEKTNLFKKITFFVLSITFILRYLYYSIIWSIKTIRQNE